jgi:hypothetical protein
VYRVRFASFNQSSISLPSVMPPVGSLTRRVYFLPPKIACITNKQNSSSMGPSISFAPVAVQRIIYNTPWHKVQMHRGSSIKWRRGRCLSCFTVTGYYYFSILWKNYLKEKICISKYHMSQLSCKQIRIHHVTGMF